MKIIILAAGILNMLILWYFLRRISAFNIFLQFWWFSWLFLSLFSVTGLYPPSGDTIFLITTLLTAMTAGSVFYAVLARKLTVVPSFLLAEKNPKTVAMTESTFLKVLAATALPFTFFFFIRALFLIPSEPNPATYRAKVFGIGLGYSLLFRFPVIETINQFLIEPLNLAALFTGVAVYIQHQRIRLLLIGICLIAMHSMMMMGRFGLHYILIMFLLIGIFNINSQNAKRMRSIRMISLSIGIIILVLTAITFLRTPGRGKNLPQLLSMYTIDYHTVAFSIFDHHLHDSKSNLHNSSFGRSSLGPFDRLLVRALRPLGIDKNSQPEVNGADLNEDRVVGEDASGQKKIYNAFGSVLYSLYRDGGIYFVTLAGIFFGFLTARFSESIRLKNAYGMSMLIALIFIGVYGIFQPVLEGPAYLAILAIFLIHKRSLAAVNKIPN